MAMEIPVLNSPNKKTPESSPNKAQSGPILTSAQISHTGNSDKKQKKLKAKQSQSAVDESTRNSMFSRNMSKMAQ